MPFLTSLRLVTTDGQPLNSGFVLTVRIAKTTFIRSATGQPCRHQPLAARCDSCVPGNNTPCLPAWLPEKHRLTAASGQIQRNNRKQTPFFTPTTMTEDRSDRAPPTFALSSSSLPPSPPLSLPPSSSLPRSLPPRDSECPCRTDTVAIRAH